MPHDAWKAFVSFGELSCLLADERVLHAKQLDAERKLCAESSSTLHSLCFGCADKLPSVLLSGDASAALNHTLFRYVVHYMPEDGSVSSAQFAETLSARVKALSPIVRAQIANDDLFVLTDAPLPPRASTLAR